MRLKVDGYEPPRLTLRMIHSRCDELGDCLLWTGATSKGQPRCSHNGKPISLRRLVYAQQREVPVEKIPATLVCVPSCENEACLRPAHLVLRSKKTHQQILAKRGVYSAPDVMAKRAKACREGVNAKLTEELAKWARESGQTAAEAAFGLGVSKQNIHLIRQGRAWTRVRDLPVRSVFELAATA